MTLGTMRLQLLVWGRGVANALAVGQALHSYSLVWLGRCNFISHRNFLN